MDTTHENVKKALKEGNFTTYVVGFVSSLILTLGAYFTVKDHLYAHHTMMVIIITLALLQFYVQMVFFLHLGTETKPRWKVTAFVFMVTVVLILVFGSLWIMNNLNYRMTPQQLNQYLHNQDGF